ncbi:HAD family hydrolase [Pseudonocardia sp. HH130630-07]|uniref:HAD family hydrolase n=1 Tax=Pseudonocardia sp. HH130630-07 TaxID=1690815 RepID=UPI000814E1F0|nr:HAD-IA family hydrolase [Pseudonocardia sp. HH130630-07]ANY08866.1 haloacid dehalogenase [Pseudonocardia sp. HH130630-07]
MPAILFGSIGTLADTSEIQRAAFNSAFERHGLDWHWDREDYVSMLGSSGGAQRIADHAERSGEQVDADAVHATKSEIFRENLVAGGASPRPGVVTAVRNARRDGIHVALVTTTSPDNVRAVLDALAPDLRAEDFDLVVDATTVQAPKPDPAAYRHALTSLQETPGGCVAVEDNLGGVDAAVAAGLRVIAFPNANTTGHDFAAATERVESLDDAALVGDVARR